MKRKTKYTTITLAVFMIVGLVFAVVYSKTPSVRALFQRLANQAGFSDQYMCVFVPNEPSEFDTVDLDKLQAWNSSLRYVVNPQNLSVVTTTERNSLRQRFIPSDEGSERVVANIRVEARTTYELKQSIFFEEGFDWGGEVQSGKFGFGFGGGSAPTGGTTDEDGFTARLAWRGREDNTTADATLYLYSADRTMNLPYGDEIKIPNFVIPIGEWFDVKLRLTVNSEHELADGVITVHLNDELLLERENIQWQTAGDKPVIDRLIFSSFHGGNSTAWSPSEVVYAQFANTCLYD